MIITGIYFGTWMAIVMSLRAFSAEEFILIGKVIVNNTSLLMQILMPFSIFMVLLCLWFYRFKKSIGFYLGLSSFLLLIITLLMTLLLLNPIERELNQWSLTSLPSNWELVRNKWQIFYGLRAMVSLWGYGLFSWFVLAAMRKNKIANY